MYDNQQETASFQMRSKFYFSFYQNFCFQLYLGIRIRFSSLVIFVNLIFLINHFITLLLIFNFLKCIRSVIYCLSAVIK